MPRKSAPPAVEALPRIDPDDEDFSDVDGDLNNEFALHDADSDRHYVWVHNDPTSIGEYRGSVLKYVAESKAEDGVHHGGDPGFVNGESITQKDHVLMSCSKALWEKRLRWERMQDHQQRAVYFKKAADPRRGVMRRGDDGRWTGKQQLDMGEV